MSQAAAGTSRGGGGGQTAAAASSSLPPPHQQEGREEEEEELLVLCDLPEYAGVNLFETADTIELKVSFENKTIILSSS